MDQRKVCALRRRLERALRRPIPETVWKRLSDKGWVKDYLAGTLEDDPEEAYRVLKEEAADLMQFAEELLSENRDGYVDGNDRTRIEPETPRTEIPKVETIVASYFNYFFSVDDKSTVMLRATSHYFGWLANQHPEVVQIRARVLDRRTISPKQARKLIGSYAARFFPLEWFQDWKIPMVDHTSEVVGEYDTGSHRDDIDHRVTVRVDPLGMITRVRYAHPDMPVLDEDEDQISTHGIVMKDGADLVPPYNVRFPEDPEEVPSTEDLTEVKLSEDPAERSVFVASLVLSGDYQTTTRPTSVWPGSVVDDIYVLAEELADTFCWPGRDAAALFVLTGVAPMMHPVNARLILKEYRHCSRWQVEFNIAPWVSAEEVARTYRRVQEQVLKGRNRLPGNHTFEVARFVWEQERRNGYNRPPWPVLCETWNRGSKERQKDDEERGKDLFEDYRNFRTYFKRAEEVVKELNFSWSRFDEAEHPGE